MEKCLHRFKTDVTGIELPERFTFPFYYTPHRLAEIASSELRDVLSTVNWPHNFGLSDEKVGNGKMFGVLVVRDAQQDLAYLTAYSGSLPHASEDAQFVPSIYDAHREDKVFNDGVMAIGRMNEEIDRLEAASTLADLITEHTELASRAASALAQKKDELKKAKVIRDHQRKALETERDQARKSEVMDKLALQSQRSKTELRQLQEAWSIKLEHAQRSIDAARARIDTLKQLRKSQSARLQERLFQHFYVLNAKGEAANLYKIFKATIDQLPPSGAGECAAPKLLNYAFQHQLEPIAMAEFWWGRSPSTEVRKHGQFYPACRGKCEPILSFMLQGVTTDPNLLLENHGADQEIEVLYEDDSIAVIVKPEGLLSVPGKNVKDSVASRMKKRYPEASGSLITHRLDMQTSGLMIIALNESAHKNVQRQFIRRYVKKRYAAILDGIPQDNSGEVNLPLRVDLDDRPRQMACVEHGKKARTRWQLISSTEGESRVHFWPETGRTHQLRVHASHPLGIGIAIKGDDLYGRRCDRLYLHAEEITFRHPVTKEDLTFSAPAPF